jgi:hypothetical protein
VRFAGSQTSTPRRWTRTPGSVTRPSPTPTRRAAQMPSFLSQRRPTSGPSSTRSERASSCTYDPAHLHRSSTRASSALRSPSASPATRACRSSR